jgi:sugar phosphate isomerase/epimerase
MVTTLKKRKKGLRTELLSFGGWRDARLECELGSGHVDFEIIQRLKEHYVEGALSWAQIHYRIKATRLSKGGMLHCGVMLSQARIL